MFDKNIITLLGCILLSQSANGVFWRCTQDSDCADVSDSVCLDGSCVCRPGKQAVSGGSVCTEVAPYLTAECVEDFQCSWLFTGFECRRQGTAQTGRCFCLPGNHYFRGRCWPNTEMGEACTRDDQCQGVVRDPFSMQCNSTCECADGYYLRQRGECRRIGSAVGDGCVLDEDCQFEGGACFLNTFTCYDRNASPTPEPAVTNTEARTIQVLSDVDTGYRRICDASVPCPAPFECSSHGVCLCPMGYYPDANQAMCLAELGSPVTSAEQCVGFFTAVREGICSCQANFFFGEDMRTCIKAARFITDACLMDENCHTFGAHARCGAPQQWGIRSCECDLEETVWDAERGLCRLFVGIGDICEVDSDCIAGEVSAQCVAGDDGQRRCACPDGYVTHEGLCLTLGLNLGDACQISLECTGSNHSVCTGGLCACETGYQAVDGVCVPAIGGTCQLDADCTIENTACSSTGTCQCIQGFVEYQDECWPRVAGHGAACNVSEQCVAVMGDQADCVAGNCACTEQFHYRDGSCWERINLFQFCSRTSECYLTTGSEQVHCRNRICQCTFDYPYSEELGTCRSSSTTIIGNSVVILTALFYLFSR